MLCTCDHTGLSHNSAAGPCRKIWCSCNGFTRRAVAPPALPYPAGAAGTWVELQRR